MRAGTGDGPGNGGRRPAPRPLPGQSLHAARTRKEHALAGLRELELARRRGELVECDAVVRTWQQILRQVRAALLAIPGRLRARLPHLTPEDLQVIDAEIRDTLVALAEDRAEPTRLQQLGEAPGG